MPAYKTRPVDPRESCVFALEYAQERWDKWIETTKINPHSACEWADDAFRAAAEIKVFSTIIAVYDAHMRPCPEYSGPGEAPPAPQEGYSLPEKSEELRAIVSAYALDQAIRGAKSTSQSTSRCHNCITDYTATVWADQVWKW